MLLAVIVVVAVLVGVGIYRTMLMRPTVNPTGAFLSLSAEDQSGTVLLFVEAEHYVGCEDVYDSLQVDSNRDAETLEITVVGWNQISRLERLTWNSCPDSETELVMLPGVSIEADEPWLAGSNAEIHVVVDGEVNRFRLDTTGVQPELVPIEVSNVTAYN